VHRIFILGTAMAALLSVNAAKANDYDSTQPADGEESLATPPPDGAADTKAKPSTDTKATLPYTPYPAGLSWIPTPQAFRVPIPDRIFYYPPHTYVRRCPYYPRGYYWGANWRFNVIGRGNLLFFGTFRFNPYLTAAKAQRHPELRGQRRYAPPPGPKGQAALLGVAATPTHGAYAPELANHPHPKPATEPKAQVATVRKAPERRTAQTASNRRVAKRPESANSR
jgi:hypothetical protein